MTIVCAVEFHGVWENLVYDTEIKEMVSLPVAVYDVTWSHFFQLLNYAETTLLFSDR